MSDSIRNLLRELRTGLVAMYGDRLKGVYLFGSYARKEADPESDVDVLVVLDRLDRYTQEVATTRPLISRFSLQHGVSVSRVFVSQLDWADARRRSSPTFERKRSRHERPRQGAAREGRPRNPRRRRVAPRSRC
jgi:predicted nucleotidyltransferase